MGLRLGPTTDRRLQPKPKMGMGSWLTAAVIAIICVAITRAFIVQTFRIPSSSMMPTLQIGDHILVNKIIYGFPLPGSQEKNASRLFAWKEPERGEVVVFYRFSEFEELNFNTHYIKRIVAVPGDEVEVKDFETWVNGEKAPRFDQSLEGSDAPPNPNETAGRYYGPVKLEPGRYFVLGDNHGNSRDSRYYGPIHLADIEGRASFVYWSWDLRSSPAKVRWERIGRVMK